MANREEHGITLIALQDSRLHCGMHCRRKVAEWDSWAPGKATQSCKFLQWQQPSSQSFRIDGWQMLTNKCWHCWRCLKKIKWLLFVFSVLSRVDLGRASLHTCKHWRDMSRLSRSCAVQLQIKILKYIEINLTFCDIPCAVWRNSWEPTGNVNYLNGLATCCFWILHIRASAHIAAWTYRIRWWTMCFCRRIHRLDMRESLV